MTKEKTKVLLLGDSIRMSYQPRVTEILAGRAEVVGPEENCQFSAYTLDMLDGWIERLGAPKVAHWNNGLHDAGHNPQRTPAQYSVETYVANLAAILRRLRRSGAAVIWAATTPVHPNRPFSPTEWSWRNEEIDRYNAAARQLMEAEGIAVNDLHGVVARDPQRHLCDDMLHLSETGIQRCAEAVAAAVAPLI
ncbi:MAG TPA: SGNH/GDSL hydrolase family protein [Sumerlaeia bacterium]|nr:SGNH/GDSL hydrolase family protein [Sumerlaeia bacterium]